MKQIAVISGKGGTGKTTVSTALSFLASNKIIVDCDVDASNLHLLLNPIIQREEDFYSGKKAKINQDLCLKCSRCLEECRFEAISTEFKINNLKCTGCGACQIICPNNAIKLYSNKAGKWFLSDTSQGTLVHARLGIAEDNSGKLVSFIRQEAENIAEKEGKDYIIIDGPPGIGCPVIASITGVDAVLIVTEPTQSGLHDALRVQKVAAGFKIPCFLCINKADLNMTMSKIIKKECAERNIKFIGEIPFKKGVVEAMSCSGENYLDNLPKEIVHSITEIWKKIKNLV